MSVTEFGWAVPEVIWSTIYLKATACTSSQLGVPENCWTVPEVGSAVPEVIWSVPEIRWVVPEVTWFVPEINWAVPKFGWAVPEVGRAVLWVDELVLNRKVLVGQPLVLGPHIPLAQPHLHPRGRGAETTPTNQISEGLSYHLTEEIHRPITDQRHLVCSQSAI